jgi:hypothetical protein
MYVPAHGSQMDRYGKRLYRRLPQHNWFGRHNGNFYRRDILDK